MKFLYLTFLVLIIQILSFAQQKDELTDISRYLLIRDIAKFWEEDLLPLKYLTNHFELIENYIDSAKYKKYEYNLIKIDSIEGFNIYSIQNINHEYLFFAKTKYEFIEIVRDSILQFINKHLYTNIDQIEKERIIDLYNNITFYGFDVNYHRYDLIEDSTKPSTLNILRKDHDVYSMSKILDVKNYFCLLYTSPSPRDRTRSRMPSSA